MQFHHLREATHLRHPPFRPIRHLRLVLLLRPIGHLRLSLLSPTGHLRLLLHAVRTLRSRSRSPLLRSPRLGVQDLSSSCAVRGVSASLDLVNTFVERWETQPIRSEVRDDIPQNHRSPSDLASGRGCCSCMSMCVVRVSCWIFAQH